MFIALYFKEFRAPAERHVLWRVQLHAAPDGAESLTNEQL